MQTPLSVQQQFFNIGNSESDKILDGFCHKKLETLKLKGNSDKGAWNYKGTFSYDDKKGVQYNDELKIGFYFYNQMFLQSFVDRKGNLTYLVDFGKNKIMNKNMNQSVTCKTNTAMSKFWWRLANNYKDDNMEVHTRVEKDFDQNLCLSVRKDYVNNNFKSNSAFIFRFNDYTLQKYDQHFQYKLQKNLNLSLKHISPKKTQEGYFMSLGKIIAGVQYQLDDKNNLCVKSYKNQDKIRVQFGIDHKPCSHSNIKAKVDQKGKLTTLLKTKINNTFTLSVASQFNFQNGKQWIDFNNTIPVPFGYTIEASL